MAIYGDGKHNENMEHIEQKARCKMKDETIKGQKIRCYDNGGKTVDRFTVVYMNMRYSRLPLFESICMDAEPFHPQGIGQHGSAMTGRHLGKRIPFTTLPPDCQKAVLQDLTPDDEILKRGLDRLEKIYETEDAQ